MNIFYLSECPVESAQSQCDKHVVKMSLETAQLLCTARHELGESADTIPYKKTHVNHPCSIWARKSFANYKWLCGMGIALCKEYTHRYGKVHKCQAVIQDCIENTPTSNVFEYLELTTFPQAMPDEYKTDDPVLAYRNYYNVNKRNSLKCVWTNRQEPSWWKNFQEISQVCS